MQADIDSLSSDIKHLKGIYDKPVFQNSHKISSATLKKVPSEIDHLRSTSQYLGNNLDHLRSTAHKLGNNQNSNYPVVYYSSSPIQPFKQPDRCESTKYYRSDDAFRHSKIKSLAPPTHGLTLVGP